MSNLAQINWSINIYPSVCLAVKSYQYHSVSKCKVYFFIYLTALGYTIKRKCDIFMSHRDNNWTL